MNQEKLHVMEENIRGLEIMISMEKKIVEHHTKSLQTLEKKLREMSLIYHENELKCNE